MITLQHTAAPAVPEHAVWAGAQVLLLGVLGGTVGLGPPGWLAGTAYGLATWVLLAAAMVRAGVRSPGPADRVTLARGVLVGAVAALVADRMGEDVPVGLLVVFAAVALSLDFVDGRVARRTGTASPMGARFDMEVDAFLILVLSVHVALSSGLWVLAIGLMRYVFVAVSWVAPWLRGELPPSFARKAVAAVQGVLLVVAASGAVPFATVLVELALAALGWSFGRDVAGLWRTRDRVAAEAVVVKEYSHV
ncbi:CDP-alcohol phosphatidyltransferase family protein [Actinosynnema sp. NPDC047251]|uniref:Integral membrane protein n=1 Tax=Saccharothrix espanaensis (strain ATCC 51144 / DSM 44229 / JCM 9112 / NBRC 15066 / NRRL 15764) TaxID=1179773 RepID=K0K1G0_SACES|nr:CDP-alcohol phosphatidyltransferase family protein [Saccharothrix espanaensis]CCH31407.1 Integral membrane protein [Saccharothrix espanaensis DSM 44229]